MPPSAVKTVKDLILWQYAKLIARSAGFDKNYRFIMNRFKQLQNGKINWSGSIREYIKERERSGECIYCGSRDDLSVDHLIPRNRGGPDIGDNAITACKSCNSSKGDRGVYEWYGLDRRNEVPRLVEGKYLKLLYQLHEEKRTLDTSVGELKRLCEICTVGYLCEETMLTVYCLESVLLKGNR